MANTTEVYLRQPDGSARQGFPVKGGLWVLEGQVWEKMFEMPQIAIVAGCFFGCMIAIAGIIATHWYKAQKMHSENELKRTMVDRGLPADEIERILAAESGGNGHYRR